MDAALTELPCIMRFMDRVRAPSFDRKRWYAVGNVAHSKLWDL